MAPPWDGRAGSYSRITWLETVAYMRLPFFYGWSIVAIAFVTMGVGVNARTAFSLFFPPILDEFGWPRGLTAGAFSFGFLVSAGLRPPPRPLRGSAGPRAGVCPRAAPA